tara:strand:+ start:8184 stop:8873 length:690 start_codon:yes stop_codon:yes gene_type:complete
MTLNEFDEADFDAVYQGKNLLKNVKINKVPWDIGTYQPFYKNILASIKQCPMLDVGCGQGYNARLAAKMGFDVTAVDSSASVIKSCIKYTNPNLTFMQRDVCQTDFTHQFGLIVDSALYHSLPSDKRLAYMHKMNSALNFCGEFHIITFKPSLEGMPIPLAITEKEILSNAKETGWMIDSITDTNYLGNYDAISEFIVKKKLNIKVNESGHSILPCWHIILKKANHDKK